EKAGVPIVGRKPVYTQTTCACFHLRNLRRIAVFSIKPDGCFNEDDDFRSRPCQRFCGHSTRAICGREDWRKFRSWNCTEDGRLHQGSGGQRYSRNRSRKDRAAKGKRRRKEIRRAITDHTKTSTE